MHQEKCEPAIGHSLLNPVFRMFHSKMMDKQSWRKKKRAKMMKKWKRALMWAAFYGAMNGVFKFLLSEGKKKMFFRK